MPNLQPVVATLAAFMLASCGSPEPTAGNEAGGSANGATANIALEEAGASGPGPAGAPAQAGADPAPPPDAVSHPDGYLPGSVDPVPPPAPEGTAEGPAGPSEKPPATEDEYMRNRQAGR